MRVQSCLSELKTVGSLCLIWLGKLTGLSLYLFFSHSSAHAQNIQVTRLSSIVRITIPTRTNPNFSLYRLHQPPRIILLFPKRTIRKKTTVQISALGSGVLKTILFTTTQKEQRVTLLLRQWKPFQVQLHTGQVILEIKSAQIPSASVSRSSPKPKISITQILSRWHQTVQTQTQAYDKERQKRMLRLAQTQTKLNQLQQKSTQIKPSKIGHLYQVPTSYRTNDSLPLNQQPTTQQEQRIAQSELWEKRIFQDWFFRLISTPKPVSVDRQSTLSLHKALQQQKEDFRQLLSKMTQQAQDKINEHTNRLRTKMSQQNDLFYTTTISRQKQRYSQQKRVRILRWKNDQKWFFQPKPRPRPQLPLRPRPQSRSQPQPRFVPQPQQPKSQKKPKLTASSTKKQIKKIRHQTRPLQKEEPKVTFRRLENMRKKIQIVWVKEQRAQRREQQNNLGADLYLKKPFHFQHPKSLKQIVRSEQNEQVKASLLLQKKLEQSKKQALRSLKKHEQMFRLNFRNFTQLSPRTKKNPKPTPRRHRIAFRRRTKSIFTPKKLVPKRSPKKEPKDTGPPPTLMDAFEKLLPTKKKGTNSSSNRHMATIQRVRFSQVYGWDRILLSFSSTSPQKLRYRTIRLSSKRYKIILKRTKRTSKQTLQPVDLSLFQTALQALYLRSKSPFQIVVLLTFQRSTNIRIKSNIKQFRIEFPRSSGGNER